MGTLMVSNSNGKMAKSSLKTLRSVAKLDWKYEETAKCFIAEIDDIEEAKFVAMKIVAAITQELPACYCAYLIDRTTVFYHDRLGYRKVEH